MGDAESRLVPLRKARDRRSKPYIGTDAAEAVVRNGYAKVHESRPVPLRPAARVE